MKIGELLLTFVVAIAVTVFVFFRCKSILEEKDEPAQDHIATQQGQNNVLNATENPSHDVEANTPHTR